MQPITFDLSALLFNPELARRFNAELIGAPEDSRGLFDFEYTYNGVIATVTEVDDETGMKGFWDGGVFADSIRSLLIVTGNEFDNGFGRKYEARINSRGEIVYTNYPNPEKLSFIGLYIEPISEESANEIRDYFGAAAYGVKSEIAAKYY